MKAIETNRLLVRKMHAADAPFMLSLLNEPTWLKFIGDRGVKTLADAERYIQDGPLASYQRYGFGFYLVALKDCATPVGICGLAQRDYLPDPDIGYAMLAQFEGKGYASESAAAVLEYARSTLRLPRLLATTRDYNHGSAKILEKIGMRRKAGTVHSETGQELIVFEIELNPAQG